MEVELTAFGFLARDLLLLALPQLLVLAVLLAAVLLAAVLLAAVLLAAVGQQALRRLKVGQKWLKIIPTPKCNQA